MADKHTMNYDVRELKLGASFTNNKATQYHTIKYDFKPASVDVNKMATVSVGNKNEVTVTVPHLAGAGVPQTVFKGNQKPYTKECVLFIDRVTGEITLEKLSSTIQVKKTRQETAQKPRPLTPVTTDFTNTTQRSTSRTRVATNRRTNPVPNNNNPGPAGPQSNPQARFNGASTQKPPTSMVRSPQRMKTSPPQAPWSGGGNSTLASLPMIGFDDALGSGPAAPAAPTATHNGYAAGVPAPANTSRQAAPHNAHGAHNSHAPLNSHGAHTHGAHNSHGVHNSHGAHNAHGLHNSHGVQSAHGGHNAHGAYNAHAQERSHVPQQNTQAPPDDSSSSSSSDSDSDSGSDSDDNDSNAQLNLPNGTNNAAAPNPALPTDVLNDDLCLSESESSDSD